MILILIGTPYFWPWFKQCRAYQWRCKFWVIAYKLEFWMVIEIFVKKRETLCIAWDILFNHSYRPIGQEDRVFANGLGDLGSVPRQVMPKTQKLYLVRPWLTLSIKRYVSWVKWGNQVKEVSTVFTPRGSSYWNRSLRFTLDYGHQNYFTFTWCIYSSNEVLFKTNFFLLTNKGSFIIRGMFLKRPSFFCFKA